MKTTLKNIVAILVMALLPALLGAAQVGAVEYKNSYQQSVVGYQPSGFGIATTATAPTATFQSTSAYSGQWTEQSSMLNSDGSVNAGAYMTSGPNRAKMGGPGGGPGSSPGTPGGQLDPNAQQPLGDVLMPMMLLVCAYAIYKVSRRRKEA